MKYCFTLLFTSCYITALSKNYAWPMCAHARLLFFQTWQCLLITCVLLINTISMTSGGWSHWFILDCVLLIDIWATKRPLNYIFTTQYFYLALSLALVCYVWSAVTLKAPLFAYILSLSHCHANSFFKHDNLHAM